MIASLPMYARPELSAPLERYWSAIRDHLSDDGIDAPIGLEQSVIGIEQWARGDLLLSQTCGAPYRDHLHETVQLVGTPDARILGCTPGYYQSVFIARDLITWGEALDLKWAANEFGSQSGYFAAISRAPNPLRQPTWSGSHLSSIEMVKQGNVDWAAIDAVTWDIATMLGTTDGLIVWDRSKPTPGLPYITAQTNDPAIIARAIRAAINDLTAADQHALRIYDLADIPSDAYLSVFKPQTETD